MKRRKFVTAVAIVCVLWSSVPLANQVVEFTLQERIQLSSVVVVGEAINAENLEENLIAKRYVDFRVKAKVKGKVGATVRVLVKRGFAETDTDCCVIGRKYLLFLKKLGASAFTIVNGPYGVYEIRE